MKSTLIFFGCSILAVAVMQGDAIAERVVSSDMQSSRYTTITQSYDKTTGKLVTQNIIHPYETGTKIVQTAQDVCQKITIAKTNTVLTPAIVMVENKEVSPDAPLHPMNIELEIPVLSTTTTPVKCPKGI